jgi:glucokinase
VGIGFGGPVDDATRSVIKSHQIQGWDGFPLADWIAELLGIPAMLGNDADCAGLGEALFGAGKGLSPIFYITIGSGIGGGLIINGEIYRGCGRGAAEIGHLINIREPETLEERASGWAIARLAKSMLKADLPAANASLLHGMIQGDIERLTAQHVGQAANLGDQFARQVLAVTCCDLAEGICNLIALLCPRRIIIGGGVSQIGERQLLDVIRSRVAERVFQPFAGCYDIVPAALGEEVVVHGALALARRRLAGSPS